MKKFSNKVYGDAFSNLEFSEDNIALCKQHQRELKFVYLRSGLADISDFTVVCGMCEEPEGRNLYFGANFKAFSQEKCCVISPHLNNLSETSATIKNPSLEIEHHLIEHELYDMDSDGYGLRGLVYMKDQGILATCSKNGSICFWSVAGEKPELKIPKMNLEKRINFAKYCLTSDGRRYLAVGTDQGARIYRFTQVLSEITLVAWIHVVIDLEFFQEDQRIVAVNHENIAEIWNLDNLKLEKSIDLKPYGIKGEVHTVIYMKATGELAIEHKQGLSIIKDWQQETGNVRHHFVEYKDGFGCKYLPNKRWFIMSNGSKGIQILHEEDLTEVRKYDLPQVGPFAAKPNFTKRFEASEDEHVIISNSTFTRLGLFSMLMFKEWKMNYYFEGIADVEMMENQYRIALANETTGIVTIYRVNANVSIDRGEGCRTLPAVGYDLEHISSGKGPLRDGNLSSGVRALKKQGAKANETSRPARRGKKIQKIEVKPKKEVRKKVTATKKEAVKKNEDMEMEGVRTRGRKQKAKEEQLPEDEKKRGRSTKKEMGMKEKEARKTNGKNVDKSKDQSRSRSKSKSVTRKKK